MSWTTTFEWWQYKYIFLKMTNIIVFPQTRVLFGDKTVAFHIVNREHWQVERHGSIWWCSCHMHPLELQLTLTIERSVAICSTAGEIRGGKVSQALDWTPRPVLDDSKLTGATSGSAHSLKDFSINLITTAPWHWNTSGKQWRQRPASPASASLEQYAIFLKGQFKCSWNFTHFIWG